jgi:hypothetical protein
MPRTHFWTIRYSVLLRRAEEDTVDKNPTSTHTVAKNTGSTTNTTLEKDTDGRVGEIEPNPVQKFWSRQIRVGEVEKNDLVRFKKSGDTEWTTGEVGIRAGKSSGKYSRWWNINMCKLVIRKQKMLRLLKVLRKSQWRKIQMITRKWKLMQ